MISNIKAGPRWLTALVTLASLAALALTAACGGGSSQQEVFVPQRLLVFGDDNSVIAAGGRKYSVNGLTSASVFDCNLEPIWVQQLAGLYGFVFAECNNNATANPRAIMRAGVGAKVADVSAQVDAQIAAGGFADKDLATVLAGGNDVLELYRQYPGVSEAALLNEARARGRQLGQVVNRLVAAGVKVVVSDLPDMGMTPYALSERASGAAGFDRAALITRLTVAFNEQLGVNIVLDGRFVGLVQSQLRFEAINRFPASFGLSNITQPICTVALPDCTTATLVSAAVTSQYLWADATRLAPGGHAQLGALAADRAQRNPF